MIKINDQELSKNEFQGACYNYMSHTRKQELSPEDKMVVANQLVDTNLLLTEGKTKGYNPTEEEVDSNFVKLLSQFQSEEQFENTLKEMGDTREVVKDRLKDDIILKAYIEGEFYSNITISDDSVEAFYKENEEKFVSQDEVKASHILVKEESLINEISEKVKKGESFEDLAKENSDCPSGKSGGDLGFFGKGKMVPEFETTAFAMDIDQISDPFKTDFGFHILKVTGKNQGGKQELTDVAQNIKRHLEQVEAQGVISKKVAGLREAATIEIDQDAL